MKVTMLSERDFASSGYKMCEAIDLYTDIDIDLFTGPHKNNLQHPLRNLVTGQNFDAIQQRIHDSDIIHLKGDWPPVDGYLGFEIMHKPIVITVSGSFFRRKHHGGFESFSFDQYTCYRTSFEPDLLYPDFSDVWMPLPIDSELQPNSWTQSNVLMHMPTARARKGTDFILRVFDQLPECDIRLIEGVPFSEAVRLRKEATIFFDQFMVGFYGNSAIEAMQYGIPVSAWLSPASVSQANGQLSHCPVLTTELQVDKWADMIRRTLDSDMTALSQRSKQWCDMIHGYWSIAKKWEQYYIKICA